MTEFPIAQWQAKLLEVTADNAALSETIYRRDSAKDQALLEDELLLRG